MAPRKSNRKGKKSNLATVKEVKKMINSRFDDLVEEKYYSDYVLNQSFDTGGQVLGPFTDPSQGDRDSDRIGDKIRIDSFHLRMIMYPPNLSLNKESNFVRVIVFQWYQDTTVTVPVTTDILSIPNPSVGYVIAHYRHDGIGTKFSILFDKVYTMTNNEDGGQYSQIYINKRISLKYAKRHVQFVSGGLNGMNHLFMLCISDSGVSNHPYGDICTRIHYTDA